MSAEWDWVPERFEERLNSKRDKTEARKGKKAGVKQVIAREESERGPVFNNARQGQRRKEPEADNVKLTTGDIRSPRLMNNIVRKQYVAWASKALRNTSKKWKSQ